MTRRGWFGLMLGLGMPLPEVEGPKPPARERATLTRAEWLKLWDMTRNYGSHAAKSREWLLSIRHRIRG